MEKENTSMQTNAPAPNKPKKTRKIVAFLAIIIFLLIGFFLLWKLAKKRGINVDINTGSKNGIIAGKIPEGDQSGSVSKEIGEKGGEISIKTGSGRTATLSIPPGAVKGKKVITVTPAVSSNSGGGNNNPGGNSNSGGSNNPNGGNNGGNSGANSGGNSSSDPADEPGVIITPADLHFNTPAWVNFSWNTSLAGNPSGAGGSGTSNPDFSMPDGVLDMSAFKGIGGIPDSIVVPGNSNGNAKKTAAAKSNSSNSVIITTDSSGNVTTGPAFGGADGSTGGPVSGGGFIQPQTPSGENGKSLLENAAAKSGGKCSEEFLLAASYMMKQAVTAEERSDYSSAIRDCLNIEWLKNLCQNDKMKLRRVYFEQRMPIAAKYDSKIADELRKLEEDCVGQYKIAVSKGNEGREGNFSMSANLCGYIDDEWTAEMKYKINIEAIVHSYSGNGKFTLPYTGGALIPGEADGDYEVYAAGTRIFKQKLKTINVMANFNKDKNILDFTLMNNLVQTGVPINLSPMACVDPHSNPSLAPLGTK